MVDPSADLPSSLRPPGQGDTVVLTYHTDIGQLARVGDTANYLKDLDTAINLGERWGIKIAEAASYQELISRITRQGPDALEDAVLSAGYRIRDLGAAEEWIQGGSAG